jgi:hypothetical protein
LVGAGQELAREAQGETGRQCAGMFKQREQLQLAQALALVA